MSVPLVLLHGSGGTEKDLVPAARAIAEKSPVLALRGSVSADGGYAFFRRFPDRRIDETDIALRVPVLARCIEETSEQRGFRRSPLAIGFSNGAIMTAALLLSQPTLLAGAILFRPLAPFSMPPPVELNGTPVLIIDGREDDRRSPDDGRQLSDQLKQHGAQVTHHVILAGHLLGPVDYRISRAWIRSATGLN